MSDSYSLSTQYEIQEIGIDGQDVIGLFNQISIYENIFRPVITGSVVLVDSDAARFIDEYKIEGNEPFTFTFTNYLGEELFFEGVLNGQRDKVQDTNKVIYTFDFCSLQVLKNEQSWVTKRFNEEKPEDVVKEMIERIEEGAHSDIDIFEAKGEPISFLGSRRRPTDIIGYVLKNSVMLSGEQAQVTDQKKVRTEQSSGSTGSLCWQTLDGYRYGSIDDILERKVGTDQGEFLHRLQQRSIPLAELMNTVIQYNFEEIGDMQTKARSGAFRSVNISFDMDKGLYKEVEYIGTDKMTEKQQDQITKPTRYVCKPFVNERFQTDCARATPDTWDKSRKTLQQNEARQNTFTDQAGTFVLPPRFQVRAGDFLEVKIPRVQSIKDAGYNEKHSGYYVIKQVGHHILSDGRAYTKIKTVRSTTQQDDASSQ